MDVNLNLDSLCLSDPKNQLQYQFYKVSLALQSLAAKVIPALTETVKKFYAAVKPCLKAIRKARRVSELENSPEVWMASIRYKKLAHLAHHSKKKRVRIKNLKRLYKLGLRIGKSEVK